MEPKSEKKGLTADLAKLALRCSESMKMKPEGSQKACRKPVKKKQSEKENPDAKKKRKSSKIASRIQAKIRAKIKEKRDPATESA